MDISVIAELMKCSIVQAERAVDRGDLVIGTVENSTENGVEIQIPAANTHSAYRQIFRIRSGSKIREGDSVGISIETYGSAVIYRPIFIIGKFESWKL